ncbi:MAG: J domain-containing protein [Ardenticatenia bacterium]|nr:J domain-containing protein [Ardenticatenia bacterium]
MNHKDYYNILGVPPSASHEEIKRAYRRLARLYHPDRNPHDRLAEEKFKEINEAYQVLSDPEQRRVYDARRHLKTNTSGRQWRRPTSSVTFEDLLDALRGGAKWRRPSSTPSSTVPAANVEHEVEITLREAYEGTHRLITMDAERFEVKIPPGVVTGSRVRVRGKGRRRPDGTRGDLFLIVHVLDDPLFKREGDDLSVRVPVDLYTAVLGGEVRVPTLNGAVMLKIPPGTNGGTRFRIRGKGMPRLKRPRRFGDLYAEVEIQVPQTLSAEERQLFERLRHLHQQGKGM